MSDYNNAKPSFQIEDQLPGFIETRGAKFIDFIKTYYDWIETKYVILTLKSVYDFSKEEITGQTLTIVPDHFQFIMEDDPVANSSLISDESTDVVTDIDYQNTVRSLLLDGVNQYGDVSSAVVSVASSWTIACWIKINTLPSDIREDYDVITLSNSSYICPLKISYLANEIQGDFNGTKVKTGMYIYKNTWNFITIRYDSVTKEIHYDLYNQLLTEYDINNQLLSSPKYFTTLDLSALSSNRFVVGCDLYNSRNFYNGYIDELATWTECLDETRVGSMYNNGNPQDLLATFTPSTFNSVMSEFDDANTIFDQTTGVATVANYWKFDSSNSTITINSVDTINNLHIYHDPIITIDVPLNTIAYIQEEENSVALKVLVKSCIKYDNIPNNMMGNRLLAFCEHISGKLQTDVPVYTTYEGVEVLIDNYIDAKNPLNVINNIENFQEIDYSLKYGNFMYNDFYINAWKELMYGFPIYLHDIHDESIKEIIAKEIKDFYLSKGTLKSFKYLFKILYNEDLEVGTDIYFDGTFSYVIKTAYASSETEIINTLKLVSHPVGFNITLLQK
jgi:hypothetical protein